MYRLIKRSITCVFLLFSLFLEIDRHVQKQRLDSYTYLDVVTGPRKLFFDQLRQNRKLLVSPHVPATNNNRLVPLLPGMEPLDCPLPPYTSWPPRRPSFPVRGQCSLPPLSILRKLGEELDSLGSEIPHVMIAGVRRIAYQITISDGDKDRQHNGDHMPQRPRRDEINIKQIPDKVLLKIIAVSLLYKTHRGHVHNRFAVRIHPHHHQCRLKVGPRSPARLHDGEVCLHLHVLNRSVPRGLSLLQWLFISL